MIQIDLYSLFTLLSAVAFVILGIELCFKRIPSNEEFSKLNIGRWLLAAAYLLMSAFGAIELLFLKNRYHQETTIFFTVAAAAYQAILFYSALLICVNPTFAEKNRLKLWIGITTIWISVCSFIFILGFHWIVYVGLGIYVLQLSYSSYRFYRKLKESLTLISVTDKKKKVQLTWVKFSFFAIMSLSILTAIFAWVPPTLHNIFTVICVIFYIWFSIRFYTYASEIYYDYHPVMTEAGLTDTDPNNIDSFNERKQYCKEKVDTWVANKGFRNPDPDRDSAAKSIGLEKADLQWYFSACIKEEFRAWRVKLRIEDAKETLLANPNTPINELAKALGFISKTNFYAHFKRIVGETTGEFIAQHHRA